MIAMLPGMEVPGKIEWSVKTVGAATIVSASGVYRSRQEDYIKSWGIGVWVFGVDGELQKTSRSIHYGDPIDWLKSYARDMWRSLGHEG